MLLKKLQVFEARQPCTQATLELHHVIQKKSNTPSPYLLETPTEVLDL